MLGIFQVTVPVRNAARCLQICSQKLLPRSTPPIKSQLQSTIIYRHHLPLLKSLMSSVVRHVTATPTATTAATVSSNPCSPNAHDICFRIYVFRDVTIVYAFRYCSFRHQAYMLSPFIVHLQLVTIRLIGL